MSALASAVAWGKRREEKKKFSTTNNEAAFLSVSLFPVELADRHEPVDLKLDSLAGRRSQRIVA